MTVLHCMLLIFFRGWTTRILPNPHARSHHCRFCNCTNGKSIYQFNYMIATNDTVFVKDVSQSLWNRNYQNSRESKKLKRSKLSKTILNKNIIFLLFQILVVGGVTTLFAALFGFYVTMKEDSCLMVTYAVIIAFEFLLLVTGIVATVRLLFIIQTGLFDADVIPELTLYETDPWVRYKWDTMQSKAN